MRIVLLDSGAGTGKMSGRKLLLRYGNHGFLNVDVLEERAAELSGRGKL